MTMIGLSIILNGAASSQSRINRISDGMANALRRATLQEAQLLRRIIVMGIRRQSPGGQPFRALADSTIARKGGKTKALINRGDYIRSVNVKELGGGTAFVGVHKEARNSAGESMANIGEVLEFGTRDRRILPLPHLRPSFDQWKQDAGKRTLIRIVAQLGLNQSAERLSRRILTSSMGGGFSGNVSADFSGGRLTWRIS